MTAIKAQARLPLLDTVRRVETVEAVDIQPLFCEAPSTQTTPRLTYSRGHNQG